MNKVISNQSIYWDYKIQGVLDKDLLNEVIKFHQSSSVIRRDTNVYPYNNETLNWLKDAEFTDVLPNIYEDEIPLKVEKMNFQNSVRDFNPDMKISIDELSRVLYKSFVEVLIVLQRGILPLVHYILLSQYYSYLRMIEF
ncbi:hypothetical protein GTID1_18155 (plasmid) [Geobacillus thermodenitrificans]|uniref:hypothetical protein n=1 Tax=Geobacillus thermodenitrificans TaxID=33940 RepID=UPI000C0593D1|nr:hypothetical protein [Geobacillus thermodenitrificans]ATO39135.1 hypothetical protein GTID1_18155 [Geobacillus thermodenitrificans]